MINLSDMERHAIIYALAKLEEIEFYNKKTNEVVKVEDLIKKIDYKKEFI